MMLLQMLRNYFLAVFNQGIKHSGLGREGGTEGIEEYLNTKYMCFGNM